MEAAGSFSISKQVLASRAKRRVRLSHVGL